MLINNLILNKLVKVYKYIMYTFTELLWYSTPVRIKVLKIIRQLTHVRNHRIQDT